jgi:hypothetical protein
VNPDSVKEFENCIRIIRKYINSKMKWVRDNSSNKKVEPLLAILPTVSKNMTQSAFKMKKLINDTEGSEGIKLQAMQDRDLEGNYL